MNSIDIVCLFGYGTETERSKCLPNVYSGYAHRLRIGLKTCGRLVHLLSYPVCLGDRIFYGRSTLAMSFFPIEVKDLLNFIFFQKRKKMLSVIYPRKRGSCESFKFDIE